MKRQSAKMRQRCSLVDVKKAVEIQRTETARWAARITERANEILGRNERTETEEEVRLKADSECCLALKRILQLARKDYSVARSEEHLVFFVSLAVRNRKRTGERTRFTRKESFERTFAQFTGKTWKQLAEFPNRLRRIAAEVEHLSGSPSFDPAQTITSELPLAIYAKREFPILPTTLENYANWLEAHVSATSRFIKRFCPQGPQGRYSGFILNVSEEVKLLTGRVCDRQVADLLNAADLALNPDDPDSGTRYDEQGIALLRSRKKRKTSQT